MDKALLKVGESQESLEFLLFGEGHASTAWIFSGMQHTQTKSQNPTPKLVWLSTRLISLCSLSLKLAPRFIGPYKISNMIFPTSVCLQLSPHSPDIPHFPVTPVLRSIIPHHTPPYHTSALCLLHSGHCSYTPAYSARRIPSTPAAMPVHYALPTYTATYSVYYQPAINPIQPHIVVSVVFWVSNKPN